MNVKDVILNGVLYHHMFVTNNARSEESVGRGRNGFFAALRMTDRGLQENYCSGPIWVTPKKRVACACPLVAYVPSW